MDGDLFLILRGAPGLAQRACTRGTLGGQRRIVPLVHVRGARAMGAAPVGPAGSAAWPFRVSHARVSGKRRRLSRARATCRLKILFQLLVFPTQPLPLGLRPAQILAQPIDLATLLLDDLLRIPGSGVLGPLRHTMLMPDSTRQYKKKQRVSCADPLT